MLILRHRSRQVVVTNEKLHGSDMVGELLGKEQRSAGDVLNELIADLDSSPICKSIDE